MTQLHVYFLLRNQQAFQRLIDFNNDRAQSIVAVTSSSAGKSWSKSNISHAAPHIDVNAKDWLGRTVLHLACISQDTLEYVRLLLRHPSINVNAADSESHWTPLHRSLYHGNVEAARLLLNHANIDTGLKDLEGLTPFDLYNTTIDKPDANSSSQEYELFTWGANRNATLGLGDANDRAYPDRVSIPFPEQLDSTKTLSLLEKFKPPLIRGIKMSKLHTAVVTAYPDSRVLLCGFGNGGRLGAKAHTEYSLKTLSNCPGNIVAVALGQDHSLALTSLGEVLSWGLNRFSQLGYVVESLSGVPLAKSEEPIQLAPRRIYGPLKKEIVKGIAACKTASVCWTASDVFTWGTNDGQLGYEKAAQPVQVLPRKVSKVTKPVLSVSITQSAMACLLETREVICFCNDRSFKINFPTCGFPTDIQPYRPPQASRPAQITAMASSGDFFAALSSIGEVFTFSVASSVDPEAVRKGIKPLRVSALKKEMGAVKDIAVGSEGSMIICTESGHVYVRSRTASVGQPNKSSKFQRIPFLQHVAAVCANNAGSFGALKVEYKPLSINVVGNRLSQDLSQIQCFPDYPWSSTHSEQKRYLNSETFLLDDQDELNDESIQSDLQDLFQMFDALSEERTSRKTLDIEELCKHHKQKYGADLTVVLQQGAAIPVHKIVLAARSPAIQDMFISSGAIKDSSGLTIRYVPSGSKNSSTSFDKLQIKDCHLLSMLIFLDYLYTDKLLAVWDSRLAIPVSSLMEEYGVSAGQVRSELQALARALRLPPLVTALGFSSKYTPQPSLQADFRRLYEDCSRHIQWHVDSYKRFHVFAPDVILKLSDKEVFCHSVILRSRSPFFAALFTQPEWTQLRWRPDGTISVEFRHLRWNSMSYVLKFIYYGIEGEMFDDLVDFVDSGDGVIEFMFDVLAAANELLLQRLVLICSDIILQFTTISNVCYVFTDATHFQATALINAIQDYISMNLETLLESHMLDDLTLPLIKQLTLFIGHRQRDAMQVTRSNKILDRAMVDFGGWLSLQDIPSPMVQKVRPAFRESPKLSPGTPVIGTPHRRVSTAGNDLGSPTIRPAAPSPPTSAAVQPTDDIFSMDDIDTLPPPSLMPATKQAAWKPSMVPRVEMKTIMAETAASQAPPPIARKTPAIPFESSSSSPISQFPIRPAITGKKEAARPTGFSPTAGSSPWATAPIRSISMTALSPKHLLGSSTGTPRTPGTPRPINEPQLGPTIAPSRHQPRQSLVDSRGSNRVGQQNAWQVPPKSQPTVSQPSTEPGMSFLAIQQLQQEQVASAPKEKRSLLEIQAEERDRQAEEDFLKWWAAEEERLKLAADPLDATNQRVSASNPQRRGKSNRGKGRGRHKSEAAASKGSEA